MDPGVFTELFKQWWKELDESDRSDFLYTDRGTEGLARFVCALEMATLRWARTRIGEAYALAFNIPLEEARKKAYGRLGAKHPAVINLRWRLQNVSRELAWSRLEVKYIMLLERMLDNALEDGATALDRYYAANCLNKFGQIVKMEAAASLAERRVISVGRAKIALTGGKQTSTALTADNAEALVKTVISQLGADKVKKILDNAAVEGAHEPDIIAEDGSNL